MCLIAQPCLCYGGLRATTAIVLGSFNEKHQPKSYHQVSCIRNLWTQHKSAILLQTSFKNIRKKSVSIEFYNFDFKLLLILLHSLRAN